MDYKEKAELFNDFFTKQCSFVDNSKFPAFLTRKTQTKLMVTMW